LRLVNLFRGSQAERELAREIEAHLALLQEDFERGGMPPEEARLAAKRAYGGVEQTKEVHRDARSFVWIEQFFKDVRYGWVNLRRNPGFTLTAVIALALGIGVNATIFGIYNAVALKPLPIADPDNVVRIERWFASNSRGNNQYEFAYAEYQYLRDHSTALSGVMATRPQVQVLASMGEAETPEHLSGYAVSANYFSDLGVKPRLGRTFLSDEDRALGANPVVVLSHNFWERKFQGDSKSIGQSIKLNGLAYTIVGVAPQEFTGTDVFPLETDFWAPFSMIDQLDPTFGPASNPAWREQWRDSSSHPGIQLLARIKTGIPRAQAQAETDLLMRQRLSGYRESDRTTAVTLQKTAYFFYADDIRFHAAAAAVLMIVSLVLLVACANVANMLLARGVARQREIGVRMALGASRGRIIRQLLAESVLLSLLGGAAGVLLSAWAERFLWVSLSGVFQGLHFNLVEPDLNPDVHVFLYGLGLCLFTGLLFGLAPALQCTRVDLNAAIKEEGWTFGVRLGRSRLRGLLLGTQVTVSVLLLVFCIALTSSFVSSRAADPGFETRDTFLLMTGPSPKELQLRERLETLPELSGAAIGSLPLNGTSTAPMAAGKLNLRTEATLASDGYFETLGIRLLRGRGFTRQEADLKAPVAVISESTARHVWPGENPLGKHISLDLKFQNKFTDFEIVGVTSDARFADITEIDALHVYLPSAEIPKSGGLVVRVRADRGTALAAVRSVVQSVDPSLLPGLDMVSLEGFVAVQRGYFRVETAFAGALSLLALTLAGVGIYGVTAFLVSQRTREIGIRVALGATSRRVVRSVLIEGSRPVLIGMAIGFATAAGLNVVESASDPFPDPVVRSVFGDPSIYGGLTLMLAIAVIASIVPASRALRVDPMVALRYE